MDLCEAQDLVRWAAPPSWPNDIVVRVTGLLCDGRSVRSTARAVKVQRESVARVRRVLRAAGARLGRGQLHLRLPTIWSCPSRAILAVASRVVSQRGRESQFQRQLPHASGLYLIDRGLVSEPYGPAQLTKADRQAPHTPERSSPGPSSTFDAVIRRCDFGDGELLVLLCLV